MDSFDDGFFECLKCFLKLRGPREYAAGAEKRLEGCHQVAQLGVVRDLVNEAKPTPDIYYTGGGGDVSDGVEVF